MSLILGKEQKRGHGTILKNVKIYKTKTKVGGSAKAQALDADFLPCRSRFNPITSSEISGC
jgi:hypothetical protein